MKRTSLVCHVAILSFVVPSFAADSAPAVALFRAADAGITAEALSATGAGATFAEAALARLDDADSAAADLDSAHAAADAAAALLSAAQDALAAEPGNVELLSTRDAAQAAFDSALAALDSARLALRLEALGEDGAQYAPALAAHWAAGTRAVPVSFRAVERSEEEWDLIENALKAEARAQRLQSALDEAQAALLAAVRSEAAVVAAEANLAGSLEAVRSAFVPTS